MHTEMIDGEESMKKPFAWFALCFFVTASVFGQAVNRAQYTAIDPFDYKLDEDSAASGAVRRFRSVVRFVSRSGEDIIFSSLDQNTSLDLKVTRQMSFPSAGQIVTIYYTATKRGADTLVLDEIDTSNTTEAGIGLVKSSIPASSGIRRSDYQEVELPAYHDGAASAAVGEVRKYRSAVRFSSQNGLQFTFDGRASEDSESGGSPISFRVRRRFPALAPGREVIIYYTATSSGIRDLLTLDDIEF